MNYHNSQETIVGPEDNTGIGQAIEQENVDYMGVEDAYNERTDTISKLENLAFAVMTQLTNAFTRISEKPQDNHNQEGPRVNNNLNRIVVELVNRHRHGGPLDEQEAAHTRTITFPGRRKTLGTKTLAQLLRIVDAMHEALVHNQPITKRDLYYRDVQLFRTQSIVDSLVDDIAATLHVNRSCLNIRASAKGLFCGSGLTIRLQGGEKIRGKSREATLIPTGEDITEARTSQNVSWVLIVEKDAIFQTLSKEGLTRHSGLKGPGILITGKGYPDVATRQLVKRLSKQLRSTVPILILVDADPHGIDIAFVYKFGSSAMKHEQGLTSRRVKWIGVSHHDMNAMCVSRDALLPITQHDYKKAISILKTRHNMPTKWRKELVHMLHTRRKAEIEILGTASSADRSFEGEDGDEARPIGRRENPLVRFVVEKINTYVVVPR